MNKKSTNYLELYLEDLITRVTIAKSTAKYGARAIRKVRKEIRRLKRKSI